MYVCMHVCMYVGWELRTKASGRWDKKWRRRGCSCMYSKWKVLYVDFTFTYVCKPNMYIRRSIPSPITCSLMTIVLHGLRGQWRKQSDLKVEWRWQQPAMKTRHSRTRLGDESGMPRSCFFVCFLLPEHNTTTSKMVSANAYTHM